MDDGVIIFIPYGSRLGFHVGGPASTMANIDYKFPQCVCYEVQMDDRVKVFNESGHGYWMEGCGTLRAEGENRPSRPGHIVILNDQGGAVMDVSYEKTATLRAQDHGHAPVICFEPGIMSRDCSAGNRAYENLCSTLRANMGDNQPAVCYEAQMDEIKTVAYDGYNMAVNDNTFMTITSGRTDDHHVPSVIYSLEGNGSRPSHQGTGYSDEGKMFTLNTIEKHAVCYGISSYASNAMLSDNPHSGIYEAKTSRCLDLNGGNPACHQGGMIVVVDKTQIPAFCYDARGNGDGVVAPTITGDHNGHISDYTSVVVIDHSRRHSYQPLDVFPTMEAHMGTGGGNVPLILVENSNESISKEHGSLVCEDGQRPVRSGRIQRHDPCDRERNA